MGAPIIIEAALNGGASKTRNPNVPKTPEEIAADAFACLDAGAGIIHTHVEPNLTGEAAADRYMEGWAPVLSERPDTIFYATVGFAGGREERFNHNAPLARRGMRMATLDPGSVNLGSTGPDGLPGRDFLYATTYGDIAHVVDILAEHRLGPSIAIYEPGWLRTVIAYHKAGKLPAGAFVKFYFGGDYNFLDGKKGEVAFGLRPTEKALDAYLELMEGLDLPWAVSTQGGDVAATPLVKLAIERGGHVRVGLEDFAGETTPSNAELVAQIAEMARAAGREPATSAETARILRLPN